MKPFDRKKIAELQEATKDSATGHFCCLEPLIRLLQKGAPVDIVQGCSRGCVITGGGCYERNQPAIEELARILQLDSDAMKLKP